MTNDKTAHELFKSFFHNYTVKKVDLKSGDFHLSTKAAGELFRVVEKNSNDIIIEAIYGYDTKLYTNTNFNLEVYPEIK